MKKLKLVIPLIKILFQRPSILFKTLFHLVKKYDSEEFVKNTYQMAGGLPQIELSELFADFEETVAPYTNLYGTSQPIDLAILKKFAKSFVNCNYLEIGTWRGESLANVAPFCRKCVSISLSNEDMGRMGWGKEFQDMQRIFSKNNANVEHIQANSQTFDFTRFYGQFDLIFIDGDHSFDGVKFDTINAFKLLKDKDSIIIWHDYTSNYEHINWEVFAGILAGTPKESLSKIYHIANSLTAICMNKSIVSRPAKYPSMPKTNFVTTIKLEKFSEFVTIL